MTERERINHLRQELKEAEILMPILKRLLDNAEYYLEEKCAPPVIQTIPEPIPLVGRKQGAGSHMTDEEKARIEEAYKAGKSVAEIARLMSRSYVCIHTYLGKCGLRKPTNEAQTRVLRTI